MDDNKKPTSKGKLIRTVIFFCVIGSLVGTLLYLGAHPKEQPALPSDAKHLAITEWKDCVPCHSPGAELPTGPKHPISNERCYLCHKPEGQRGSKKPYSAR